MPPEFNLAREKIETPPQETPRYPTLNIEFIKRILSRDKEMWILLSSIEEAYQALKDIIDQKTKKGKFDGEMIVELGTFQTSLEELARDTRLPREVIDTLEIFLKKLEEQRQVEIKRMKEKPPLHGNRTF